MCRFMIFASNTIKLDSNSRLKNERRKLHIDLCHMVRHKWMQTVCNESSGIAQVGTEVHRLRQVNCPSSLHHRE